MQNQVQSNNFRVSYIVTIILISLFLFVLGFVKFSVIDPNEVYKVYVDGECIGTVDSKLGFEEYINERDKSIKSKYGVDRVYTPNGVILKRVNTYFKNTNSYTEIYNKIVKLKHFTIKGTIIKIKVSDDFNNSTTDGEDKNFKDKDNSLENSLQNKEQVVKNKYKYVYVTNKDIFDEAIEKLILSFVEKEQYKNYMNSSQKEIVDTGSKIKDIDIYEKISYSNGNISIDEDIFNNATDLAMYLLYGTTDKQATYVVKDGDTIESIAKDNKLNTQEFLLANPSFKNENTLLYVGEKVNVGLINPIINIVVEYNKVDDEERKFGTTIKYDDSQLENVEYVSREGENGLYRVSREYQYISGQLVSTISLGSEELKATVDRVIVKGSKEIPEVADLSYWAWPTLKPYLISTYYGYRWGSMHAAIDITGPAHGTDIYAANNGVIVESKGGCYAGNLSCNGRRGNYVVINHNNRNYYTVYMHLNQINVSVGQVVSRGQKIGTMGNSGEVYPSPSGGCAYCGTHLHFQVFIGRPYSGGSNTTVDPLSLY